MGKTVAEPTRAFEMSLDLDATPEQVWQALTEADELVRWFPLGARVTPGVGGTVLWSWGEEGGEWETRIDAWEPGRLLRLVQDQARPYDTQGRPLPEGQVVPARVAIEFLLETVKGRTRLRLVHSGFGHGAAWDNELEGITEGWQAELRSLRHYLSGYRGRERQVGRALVSTTVGRDEAWSRLLGPGGFAVTPALPKEGDAYQVVTPGGQRFSGTVALHLPRQTLAGTVRELDGGWFRLLTWRDGLGQTGVWAWLATYGGEAETLARFGKSARHALERLYSDARDAG